MDHNQKTETLSTLITALHEAGVDDPTQYLDAVYQHHHQELDLLRLTALELVKREGWSTPEAGVWSMLHSALEVLRGAISDRDAHLTMCAALQAAGSILALDQITSRSAP
jgi:hypothetical protein